ncbi:MAG: corrinoid protein [Deltaproteobacteria bacterium]|nr:corrinoid protein [Deltaproteobacteria bacterium]MBW2305848.1 corrinoid protein [Deltaproteobacteria bacterium]
MTRLLDKIAQTLINGDRSGIESLVREAIEQFTPDSVLEDGLMKGMEVVGKRFRDCEMFIPEVIRSADCMKKAMEILQPRLVETGGGKLGRTVIIGTVKGDLHDIGKNLVGMMLEGGGFHVVDLGVDVAPEKFVNAVREHKPQLLGMSALLTTTMPFMKETVDALKEAGLKDSVRVIVGGAPVNMEFAREIGSDGYGPNAGATMELARDLIG